MNIQNKIKLLFLNLIILILFSNYLFSQQTIQLQKKGGVYFVPCKINGLKLSFVFDTGASDVSLSKTESQFMFKNGFLDSSDIIGKQKFIDASGNIGEATVVNLKEIEFYGYILKNVEASIVESLTAPLLLGQSALSQLGLIQVDFKNNQLKIFKKIDIHTSIEKNYEKSNFENLSIDDALTLYCSLIETCFETQNITNSFGFIDRELKLSPIERLNYLDKAFKIYELFDTIKSYIEIYTIALQASAKAQEELGKFDEAYNTLSLALSQNISRELKDELLMERGIFNHNRNKYEEALSDWKNIHTLDQEIFTPLILELIIDDKKHILIRYYTFLINSGNYENKPYHLNGRAIYKSELGDHLGAMRDWDHAILLVKSKKKKEIYSDIYINRAKERYNKKMYSGALQDVDEAIKLKPNECYFYLLRGLTRIQLNQKTIGCLDLSKAGELGCNNAYKYIKKTCN